MRLSWTFVRFLINGVVATAVHYAALVTLVDVVHLHWVGLANGIASIFGIATSYLGNRIFVFRSDSPHRRTLPVFCALYATIALVHAVTLGMWTDLLKLPYTPGFLIATMLATMITFLGNRLIFRPSASEA